MLILTLLLACSHWLQAQTSTSQRAIFKKLEPVSRCQSTGPTSALPAGWDISFQHLPNEEQEKLFQLDEVKALVRSRKQSAGMQSKSSYKTSASNPSVGINFRGNDLKSWTPTDNAIAISNEGHIVSCVNYGVDYYDTVSGAFIVSQTWNAFVNDTTLKSAKFDPRVLYDKIHNRFVLVVLHGFSSTKSKVLVCFSKTANPIDGWYIYPLSGNPFMDTAWTDYPTIGLNEDELFINANQFGDAPNYDWKGTYIYQIGLQEGYAGNPLQIGVWDSIYTPGGLDGITACPAPHGLGDSMHQQMYFVQLMPDSGSHVYVYHIQGLLGDTNKTLSATEYPIPSFLACANAFQKDPNSGFIDSLSTGSAWVQNAFYLNRTLHFTSSADVGGWCGLHYGRIYLDSAKAILTHFSEPGTDLCYPAVASLGYDSSDQSVAIAYVRSDSSTIMMPETGVISLDNQMTWSQLQTVKKGDTSVNILYPPDYPVMPERWGDYSGICRHYIAGVPRVWMAGAFGANTPPRNNSFGTWIAQIISSESQPVTVQNMDHFAEEAIVYPNPNTGSFHLMFENPKAAWVQVVLCDWQGRYISTLLEDRLSAGKNRLSLHTRTMAAGTYLLKVMLDHQTTQVLTVSIQ